MTHFKLYSASLTEHLFSNLIHGHMPYMKFLSVRPDVCLGLARDFYPLDNVHAERT